MGYDDRLRAEAAKDVNAVVVELTEVMRLLRIGSKDAVGHADDALVIMRRVARKVSDWADLL